MQKDTMQKDKLQKDKLQGAAGYLAKKRRRSIWKRVVGVLACVVVFCTVYALILPAITLENPPPCGKTEHTHSEECYPKATAESKTVLTCTQESLDLHKHTKSCRNENGELICGYSDFVVHEHNASCYDENGNLWCPLPERKAHTHNESCYTQPETQPTHTHTEECYTLEQGELICTESEEPAHIHTDECYTLGRGDLICVVPESEGHQHGEGCYDENGELICGTEVSEGHQHSSECYKITSVLNCSLSEESHQHTDACYDWNKVLICQQSDELAEMPSPVLTCGKEEIILHKHTEKCFKTDEDGKTWLICGKTQVLEHVHNQDCFQTVEEPGESTETTEPEEPTETTESGEPTETVEPEEPTETTEPGEPTEITEPGESTEITEPTDPENAETPICGLEEHTHSAACDVIGLIEALPTRQSVEECIAAFEENGNEENYDTYLTELQTQVQEALEAYEALPEKEQAKVTNIDRLKELEWILELPLEETAEGTAADVTVTNGDSNVNITEWTGDTDNVQKRLEAELLSIKPGYTIRSVEYYQINGPTNNTVSVQYNNGQGLDASKEGSQVFVYDLGTDGTALQRCEVKSEPIEGETTEGKTPEAESPEGETTESKTPEDGNIEDEIQDGDTPEAEAPEDETPEGGITEDETTEGETTEITIPEDETVEAVSTTEGEQTKRFTSFSFTIPEGSGDEPHIYAFISASPATLEELGIYLGKEQDGAWVAYDGPAEAEANVKATVTLPEGVTAPDGYSLFIRKINEGEGFYPNADAIKAEAGEYNDWQCYTIRWIRKDEQGKLSMLPLNVTENTTTTVKIEYLKDAARLGGPAGGRKLLIYNSNTDGSLADQVADTVKNVSVNGDFYKSFTFEATHAGPYVFVSKKLEKGYIEALKIGSIVDGSGAFDSTDKPGNDSSENNRIVRSYDTIQYNLEATFAARESGVKEDTVNMYFDLNLGKSATAARFDVNKMLWLNVDGAAYSIEYLDSQDNVIMIMTQDGKFYRPQKDKNGSVRRDEHGFAIASTEQVYLNSYLNGSTSGKDSYKVSVGAVTRQRLVGYTRVKAKNEGESVLAGTQYFTMAVEVRNADNGEIFAPTFRMWLEGNSDNYGPEGQSGTEMLPAEPQNGNILDLSKQENQQYHVTVSAGTNFNVQLKKNGDMSYKNWFDFTNGNIVAEPDRSDLERLARLEENHGESNPVKFTEDGKELDQEKKTRYANYRYGRITCYGIALQLYNDTDNPDASRAGKKLKGLSLPVGDITFDLNFSSEVKTDVQGEKPDPDQYTAILWDYNENVPANTSYSYTYKDPGRGENGKVTTPNDGKGNGGRNIYWDGETRSPYAKGAAPSNYIAYHNGCYYGGDWSMVDESGNKLAVNTAANPVVVTGTGKDTTYHFSVSDYDFDFDDQHFPKQDAGNTGDIEGYDTYALCFSAGCVQVLSVFPMVQKVSEAEIFLNTKVSNLKLETRVGQKLEAQETDDSKINHEVNTNDNKRRDQIVLYAPGSLTKGSAFNGAYKGERPKATNQGFLGTEYWTTSYDCSTFAGDDIWITCYGMMNPGSDFRTCSMNLLQLFDSYALSIRGDPYLAPNVDPLYDTLGTENFLYAADPGYKKGYNTNEPGVLEYMNSVREEDLVYSEDRPDNDGYVTVNGEKMKCVGVLMELRGCNLLGGKYQYMGIPVKVNGDDPDLIGKTVATVNTFRVWSYDLVDISWKNGQWEGSGQEGRNTLAGFPTPDNGIVNGEYSGELANSQTGSPPYYVKTEYEDGHQITGTHAGGTLSGNSLLLLGYKTHIDIVDGKSGTGLHSYNQSNGETVVDYRLYNISTNVSADTSQTERPTTNLTVEAVLDAKNDTGNQRISVSGGSYCMMVPVADEQGNIKNTPIPISDDPDQPTALAFTGSDGKIYPIKVHAQLGPGKQSVSFVIQNAPVGMQVPDITFKANFATVDKLKNNDQLEARAYISGDGDNRAYNPDTIFHNQADTTIGVVLSGGTNLTKAVDKQYIELDGSITYNVTYTNSGSKEIRKIYFYDLLPNNVDIRGSTFNGKVILSDVNVTSSNENGMEPADATVYYSIEEDYKSLYDKVRVFGGTIDDSGKIINRNEAEVEEMLVDSNFFHPLGNVTEGRFKYDSAIENMQPEDRTALMSQITGLYFKVENLRQGQTIDMEIKVETDQNKANDWYKNIANSWIAGTETLPLTSNQVETQVVSRQISGVVWYDRNLNGIRDDGEPLLDNVTATLFKKNDEGEYELCTKDVTGGDITSVTTGTKDTEGDYIIGAGAYSFDKLAEGDYIVAFSEIPNVPDTKEKFIDATFYQQNGENDADTNDGKAYKELGIELPGSGNYEYYIHYSKTSKEIPLSSLKDMINVRLVNGVEMHTNQDLGLIIAMHELPETGGTGTVPYIIRGLLLMTASAILLLYRRKNCGKEDCASS